MHTNIVLDDELVEEARIGSKLDEFVIEEFPADDRSKLETIGKFRLEVWRMETSVDESLFPEGRWLEPLDNIARHWIATDAAGIVGAARLSFHRELLDNPDGYLFDRASLPVPLPCAHLCKLVVHPRARGRGIAMKFNRVRISTAKTMGAKSILVTASEKNSRLLERLGFFDTKIRETFPNRPGYVFKAMQLNF